MQMMVLFDLPVETKKNRRNYAKFRKLLIDDGFIMIQYSVYSRFCKNKQDMTKHTARIMTSSPPEGNVRILSVTQKQFENMILVIGTKSASEETTLANNYTVVL